MHQITLTRQQVRQIDRTAIEKFGMLGLVLMENAGRAAVDKLVELGIEGPVAICCGKGNNAGDGLVMARHLDLRQIETKVFMWSEPENLSDDAATNYRILRKADVPIEICDNTWKPERTNRQLENADWIVDALLGTGSRGQPRPPLDRVITQLNNISTKKVAIDVPSGLDCDTGEPAKTTFRADHTLTFVAAKPGFYVKAAQQFVGEIHVLDIGAPRKLIEEVCGGKNS